MQSLRSKFISLLRRGERIFKLDMTYIVKGSFWTTLAFTIGTVASIATGIAFGNLLPKESYGIYNYLLSLGATLSFLTLSGTSTAVIRAVARGYENVVPAALRLQLKYNLIAMSMVLCGAAYYAYKANMLFAAALAMLAFAYPISQAFHIHYQVLTGRKRFDLLTKISCIVTPISMFSTLAALLLTHNVLILIATFAFVSIVSNIAVYKFVTRDIDKSTPDPEQIKEMRRTSFHLTGAGLIGTAAQYIDKIVLFHVSGAAPLAIYAFALAGPDRLQSLVKNWLSIALPNLAQRTLPEIRQVVYKRIGYSMLIGAALFLAYFIAAPFLFKLLLPRYLDAILYSRVQALSLIIIPASIYMGSVFSQQNMLRATYAQSTGSQVIYILLVLLFGAKWHIWGLIAASLLSTTMNAVYSIIVWEIESRRLIKKNA
ncbi:oligosaccharide flippase family protein [Candidatus Parcubacteria bacterium]|nr:oligosaccharide flippase family protein [Candidatus Parcubacteria bacterium]